MKEVQEIYFDNSATTRPDEAVCEAVLGAMQGTYGNPSSSHLKGVEAERLVRRSRETIAQSLRCREKEIFFTSGGTEADNWALAGAARANRRAGNHIITTAVEHAAVLAPLKALEEEGFRVTYLPADPFCRISLEDLKEALDEETILVSLMQVNNEIGTIFPVRDAAALVKQTCPGALVHTDAVQAYGKIPLSVKNMQVDLLSVSGHKLHGPKGTGFLYIREKTKIHPLLLGGGQQGGMRSGTENVPGAAGLAAAASVACGNLEEYAQRMRAVKDHLTAGLKQMDQVVIHTPEGEESAPHIVNASFVGVRSEVLLHALEDAGIYVSAGSACSSNRRLPVSPVLRSMGLPKEEQESALRFSFSRENTIEEADRCLEALNEFVPVLRRYTRR